MTLQDTAFHAAADSTTRAIANGETWPYWRLIAAGVIVAVVIVIIVVFVSEFIAIKRAGGLKAYAKDIDLVSYSGVRAVWVYEIVLGALTVAVLLRAFVPKLASDLQIDAVWPLVIMAAAGRGINLGAYGIKRSTDDPAMMATKAAINDPTVQPFVTTNRKTGETSVSTIPIEPKAEVPAAPTVTTTAPVTLIGPVVQTPSEPVVPPKPKPVVMTRDA